MRFDHCLARVAGTVLALGWAAVASAELELNTYASAQGEYNSNVFSLSNEAQARAQNGDPALSDTVQRYLGGANGSARWSGQRLAATFEGRHFSYGHFSRLDHNEYLGSGTFGWSLGSAVDGSLGYRVERRMASFDERDTTQLTMERERNASALAGVAIGNAWRVEADASGRDLESPLRRAPGFGVRETSGGLALKYRVVKTLDAGLHVSFLRGEFRDVPPPNPCPGSAGLVPLDKSKPTPAPPVAPPSAPAGCAPAGTPNTPLQKFKQSTVELTARYSVDQFSDLAAALGYSRRQDTDPSGAAIAGITGKLGYVRQLTGKTAARVEAFRRLNSFVAGANTVVEAGAGGGLTWKPTIDLALDLDYQWVGGDFRGPGSNAKRSDDTQTVSLQARYAVLSWLEIHPYYRWRERNSNVDVRSYQVSEVGIELQVRYGLIGGPVVREPVQDPVGVVPLSNGFRAR